MKKLSLIFLLVPFLLANSDANRSGNTNLKENTTGWVNADPTPWSHGLGQEPTYLSVKARGQVSGGAEWVERDYLCYSTSTQIICPDLTDLGISATNQIRIDVAVGVAGPPLQEASPTQSGFVTTSAQEFGGVKTFNDGINFGNEDLDDYDEAEFNIGNDTNFDVGASQIIKAVKVGKSVTLTWQSLTHPNDFGRSTATGFLPAKWTPATGERAINVYAISSDRLYEISVFDNGQIRFQYKGWTGADVNFISTAQGTISYVVD